MMQRFYRRLQRSISPNNLAPQAEPFGYDIAMNALEAEEILRADGDYRVLRRIPPVAAWGLSADSEDKRRAVFVDTETTGLNQDTDEVIEIALLPFAYDRPSGMITTIDIDTAYTALRGPSLPIPAASTAIHGIRDDDVRGKTIDAGRVEAIVAQADILIAHNAAFDRPMVEKHWPIFERKPWACSLADIDWRAEGLASGKLDYILMRLGWFFDGHRAMGDAEAGAFLLTERLPVSQRAALSVLLENARRPTSVVRAEETAFEQRAALRQRGYRWDPGAPDRTKAWWVLTDEPKTEVAWLNSEIYQTPRDIPVTRIPATKRYSAHLWR
jgi:DNA polymerase-3 subunit epsilon